MQSIDIAFEHEGLGYSGQFTKVSGSGSTSTFHLMINGYYYGRLRYSPNGWIFDGNAKGDMFAGLAEFFGNYIIAVADSGSHPI